MIVITITEENNMAISVGIKNNNIVVTYSDEQFKNKVLSTFESFKSVQRFMITKEWTALTRSKQEDDLVRLIKNELHHDNQLLFGTPAQRIKANNASTNENLIHS